MYTRGFATVIAVTQEYLEQKATKGTKEGKENDSKARARSKMEFPTVSIFNRSSYPLSFVPFVSFCSRPRDNQSHPAISHESPLKS
jgi:hypothetical protein